MKIRTSKELDRLLENYFQQEVEGIEPPSSKEGWAELKARLDNQDRPEQTVEINEAAFAKSDSLRIKGYGLFKKHKALTSLAAACLLFAIIFSGFSQADALKQFFASMAVVSEDDGIDMQVQRAGEEQVPMTAPDAERSPEKEAPAEDGPIYEEEARTFQTDTPGKEHTDTASDQLQIEAAAESDPVSEIDPDTHITENLEFSEHTDFLDSLMKLKSMASDDIWHVRPLPKDFEFTNGTISLSETALLNVKQDFFSSDGQRLSITQNFFQDEMAASMAFDTGDKLALPVQVGIYKGYLFRQQQGVNTVTWLQENSIVTLSGQMEDDQLFEIIELLETI